MSKIRKDLVFVCRKCEHNLFLTDGISLTGEAIVKKLNGDCPNCGEESGGLWIYDRIGNYEKEYGS